MFNLSFSARNQSAKHSKRFVEVECLFKKPCCCLVTKLFSTKKSII